MVNESKEVVAPIQESNVNAEGGEHAGVFGADDAGADEEHGFGKFGHGVAGLPHGVGVDDVGVVEGDAFGTVGVRSRGDDGVVCVDDLLGGILSDEDLVGCLEGGGAVDDFYASA